MAAHVIVDIRYLRVFYSFEIQYINKEMFAGF